MRRSRRRRETLAVSLFPFLAVLICTFGVLVILLVLAVKAADESAQKTRKIDEQEFQEQLSEWNAQLDLEIVRSEGLAEVRPELIGRLQLARDTRAHLENEIRKLNEEAELLALQLERQESPQEVPEIELIEQAIAEVESGLAAALEELESKESQAINNQPVMYSIVPHGGVGGESRLPIYIECRQDKLILQPYNISLELTDFAVPVNEQNPLDAALVTIREYFLRYGLKQAKGKPYPLLVVRPDGAASYVLARHAIRGWDDEFGYELIAANKPLAFGDVDPELAVEIRKAVDNSIRQQQRLMAHRIAVQSASYRKQRNAPTGGLRASPQFGGFVSQASGGSVESKQFSGARAAAKREHDEAAGAQLDSKASQDFQSSKNMGPQQGRGPDGPESQQGSTMSATSLASQRGENWALPSKTPNAVGYRRPIRVLCSNEELVIMGSGPSSTPVRIKMNGDMVLAVDSMIDEIWKMIESWGVTGANGYWVPELRFTTARGAEDRLRELLLLLEGSGLAVEGAEK